MGYRLLGNTVIKNQNVCYKKKIKKCEPTIADWNTAVSLGNRQLHTKSCLQEPKMEMSG